MTRHQAKAEASRRWSYYPSGMPWHHGEIRQTHGQFQVGVRIGSQTTWIGTGRSWEDAFASATARGA